MKSIIQNFLLCCISIQAYSQKQKVFLEAGLYQFQEFISGVVLSDSGKDYRFEDCRFQIHPNDTGLKAVNLNKVELKQCRFISAEPGIGVGAITINSEILIQYCWFENLDKALIISQTDLKASRISTNNFKTNRKGIDFRYSENGKKEIVYPLTILQNNFSGNQTAILLDASGTSSATDLTLKCNRFDIDNSNYAPPFYGVVLGANHRVANNRIGGNGTEEHNWRTPGANVWPIQGSPNRAIFPYSNTYNVEFQNGTVWQSPFILVNQEEVPTWFSVKNNSSNQPIKMYRYLNEFIGRVGSDVEKANVSNRCYTDANDPLTIQPGDIHECEEGIPNPTVVVFPTRMAVDSGSGTTTGISPWEKDLENSLGQNIPNPGSSEVLIPYQLNGTSKTATLEIIQMATGRTIQQISLSKEATELKLDISQYPSGVYAYTLQVDGSPVQTLKLVVVK